MVHKLMLGWVVLALIAVAVFVLLVLPYTRMPDVSNTPWHELARGVALGDDGAHQRDAPYFILGTNESPASAVAAVKRRLTSEGWSVDKDPAPLGGVTFIRNDDPGRCCPSARFPVWCYTTWRITQYPRSGFENGSGNMRTFTSSRCSSRRAANSS